MRITQIIALAALMAAACSGPHARYRETVARYLTEKAPAAQSANRFVSEAEKQETAEMLAGHRAVADSLSLLPAPEFYTGRKPDCVLAKVVRCTYSVTVEGSKDRLDETFDFWLSPDGSRVDYKRRAK